MGVFSYLGRHNSFLEICDNWIQSYALLNRNTFCRLANFTTFLNVFVKILKTCWNVFTKPWNQGCLVYQPPKNDCHVRNIPPLRKRSLKLTKRIIRTLDKTFIYHIHCPLHQQNFSTQWRGWIAYIHINI